MSRRVRSWLVVLVTIPIGIGWRHLPLPFFAWKYGGSALWTVALYFFLAAILPRLHPIGIAMVSALLSALVEFSRLIDQPQLNAFRHTLAGKLTLGSHFSLKDIAVYWITLAILVFFDTHAMARNTLQSERGQ